MVDQEVDKSVSLTLSRKTIFVAAIALFAVTVMSSGYYWFVGTPRYTLWLVEDAIEEHDIESLYLYVDVDAIASRFADETVDLAIAKSLDDLSGNPFAGFGFAMAESMKPAIENSIKDSIESSVKYMMESYVEPVDFWGGDNPNGIVVDRIEQNGASASVFLAIEGSASILTGVTEIELEMVMTATRRWKIVWISLLSLALEELHGSAG